MLNERTQIHGPRCSWPWHQFYSERGKVDGVYLTTSLLLFKAEAEFLYDRIGQEFPGNPLDFGLCSGFVQRTIEREFKKLSLADVAYSFVTAFAQRAVDGLALRIKDGSLQHDSNVGFHGRN